MSYVEEFIRNGATGAQADIKAATLAPNHAGIPAYGHSDTRVHKYRGTQAHGRASAGVRARKQAGG